MTGGPNFMGANPAEVRDGPQKGTRVLHAEEDLGRALVTSLAAEQRAVAVLSPTAPNDLLTTNTRKAAIQENAGLAYKAMTPPQRGMLLALIDEYASSQPKALAAERIAKLKKAGLDDVKFAWMGGIEKGASTPPQSQKLRQCESKCTPGEQLEGARHR